MDAGQLPANEHTPGERSAEADQEWERLIRHYHRLRWYGISVLVVVLAAALAVFGFMVIRDETRLASSCNFYKDVATAPFTPPQGHPSQLGVRIVADSRGAFLGQGCSGNLPAPSGSLIHWGNVYHVPVPR